MTRWYQKNPVGAAGVLACLLFGGIEIAVLFIGGVRMSDLYTPSGLLAQYLATLFTDPSSLIRAGSARDALTIDLTIGLQCLATLLFTLLLWVRSGARRASRRMHAALALQVLLGVSIMSSLLYVLAAQLALILPARQGRYWLAAECALLACANLRMALWGHLDTGDQNVQMLLLYAALGMLFQALAFGMARVALRERQARATLARSHASLLATQAMLADTVRATERTRIARNLHDAVGHHLTALNLHLDLALRQGESGPPEALQTSRALARTLLAEVREVVNSERQEQRINLRAAINTMCAGIPSPQVVFDYDDELDIASPTLAHTLFHCVQEALTNAMRHSGATVIAIALRGDGEQVLLAVHDDGCGAPGAAEGNGLRGMRERVEEQCGTLRIGRARGGFRIDIALPLAGSYA